MNRFANQWHLVTGASSGIGAATADRLLAEGANVVLWGRDRERLTAVSRHVDASRHISETVDVTDEGQVKAALVALKAGGVRLRSLTHAAGVHALRPLNIETAEKLSAILEVNIGSAFRVVRLALGQGLFESGAAVILVSSQAASRGSAGASAYSATKGALEAAVRSWAVELARRQVRVNAVAPGVVNTPMTERFFSFLPESQRADLVAHHLLGLGEPADVAAAIVFLASDDARWITGSILTVDGGFSAW